MDTARLAIAALATLGSGIALGLAADPTLRAFPEADWRARYRALAAAPADPAPLPGVSYYGDGSTDWAWGTGPIRRYDDDLPPLRMPAWHEPILESAPEPGLALERDPVADPALDGYAAERAATEAIVADALVRSTPRTAQQEPAPPAQPAPPPSLSEPGDDAEGLGG